MALSYPSLALLTSIDEVSNIDTTSTTVMVMVGKERLFDGSGTPLNGLGVGTRLDSKALQVLKGRERWIRADELYSKHWRKVTTLCSSSRVTYVLWG